MPNSYLGSHGAGWVGRNGVGGHRLDFDGKLHAGGRSISTVVGPLDRIDAFCHHCVGHGDIGVVAEQAVSRVDAPPACSGEKDLGPGVHVARKIRIQTRVIHVATHKTSGESEGARAGDEEGGVVAARA